jgi:hypothetical protein
MFSTQADIGPFPGIRTIHDVRGTRRWVLGVLQKNSSSPPSWSDFTRAEYFQCGGEKRGIIHKEFESWQPVGTTSLIDEEIRKFGTHLLLPKQ